MPLRNRVQDRVLPESSGLRQYLEGKEESSLSHERLPTTEFVQIGKPQEDWPRTLLLMPPITLSEGTVKRVIPPLGLCYLAASLKEQGIPCDLLDCVVEGIDHEEPAGRKSWRFGLPLQRIRDRLLELNPQLLCISIVYSSDLGNLFEVARIAKETLPQVTVLAGGLHASIYPRDMLADSKGRPLVDFVIRGEGERRICEFVRNWKNGVVNVKADGLAGSINGRTFVNPQVETIQDVDSIPFPAYDKLPIEKYFDFNVPFSPFPRGRRVMQIYTSRGCPVGCTFCASTNFNRRFRARSVENVVDEIEWLRSTYDIDELQFADDNLTFDRDRAMSLFNAIAKFGLPWCTPNGIMINTLSKKLLDAMIDSGMYQITLSVDSGSSKTLKHEHRKPVDLQRLPDLMRYLEERGVLMHGTLVVGMPGETLDEIKRGFDFVEKLPFNSIGVFIAQALPGSELYETSLAKGAITSESARVIDTAKSGMALTHIDATELERSVSDFIYRYNKLVISRNPEAFETKYVQHLDRLKSICIGSAAPNTDGIIAASEPSPVETISLQPSKGHE